MTETRTKILEAFVNISSLLLVNSRNSPRKCACCSADSSA